MTERESDVVIIGAGIAGLTAAYRIKKLFPKCSVLVLEAKDRVGGRTYTVDLTAANGTDKWDLGGQWVCRHQHHILWLLEELGIETYKQWLDGKKLMQIGGHRIKSHNSNLPPLPLLSLLDLGRALHKIENMVKQVPRDDPRLSKRANEWDNMTLEALRDQVSYTHATRDTFDIAIAMISGIRPREISALHFLHYSSMAGSFENLFEADNGGAQEWKVKGGLQQVSELLTDKIGKENVILSEPVKIIDQTEETSF
ncbi:putative flavin-containing monoamine oxidase A [Apostichopus japonicus]|uniref:Amine oxidase n=1 Tax=Stichopus japonicus TaxID=307972 RepID=A0A2G8L877_STIJA|nr:putative flavin-containing monoamine oxidase A [Apostichopus japonicus]